MSRLIVWLLLSLLLAYASANASAATPRPGTLDRAFSQDGLDNVSRDHTTIPRAAVLSPGGALVVAGDHAQLLRVSRKGGLVGTFGTRGRARMPHGRDFDGNDTLSALVRRPDGSYVIAGLARTDTAFLAAFSAAGQRLRSFGTAGRVLLPQHAYVRPARTLLAAPDGGLTWALTRDHLLQAPTQADLVTVTPAGVAAEHLAPWPQEPRYMSGAPALWFGAGAPRLLSPADVNTPAPSGLLTVGAATTGPVPDALAHAADVVGAAADVLVVETGRRGTLSRVADGGFGARRWTFTPGGRLGTSIGAAIDDRNGGAFIATPVVRGPYTRNYHRSVAVAHIDASGNVDRRFGSKGVLDVWRKPSGVGGTPILTFDRARRRLWLVNDNAYGYYDIREDVPSGHDVLVAAIRTR